MRARRVNGWVLVGVVFSVLVWLLPATSHAEIPLEGFIPLVGMGLTDEFADSTDPNAAATFFIAQPANAPGGQSLGVGNSAFYDIALFDTGAATHILTRDAHNGFDIANEGFSGTNVQQIGGATGTVLLDINDPLGVYMSGLADRTGTGANLTMQRSSLKGQTSFATLSAPTSWQLPNIIGLPIAAQHAVHIQNSNPQVFQHQGTTVRTPNIQLNPLGSGGQGIQRRAQLNLNPGGSFLTGPIYVQNLDLTTLVFHDNPLSPSVVESAGLFLDTDIQDGSGSIQDQSFLFDTGASLTVVSSQIAARLGFDPILDTPEFVLAVEGSGGVSDGIPGFYADELTLDTVGGSFTLHDVPLAVLDVTDPSDPGNIVDGIVGMNLFAGRDLVIDAIPSAGQGGAPPALYISDPVAASCNWSSSAVTGNWSVGASWSGNSVPDVMCDSTVANVRGSHQTVELPAGNSFMVYRSTIQGSAGANMTVVVNSGSRLTSFADIEVARGGRIHLVSGTVDAQFLEIDEGELTGSGQVVVGAGPLAGTVRNLGGRIAPGDYDSAGDPIGTLSVVGDLSNEGVLAFDLAGRTAGSFDTIEVSRYAFLGGELEVRFADAGTGQFNPQVGDAFVLIDASEGIFGTFDSLDLPGGYSWNVDYLTDRVRLQVTGLTQLVGDFDLDADLDCDDVNLLGSVATGTTYSATFDLTGDGVIDNADVLDWITNRYGTIPGDANLDRVVDALDLNVWTTTKFTATSNWCDGDFDTSGSIDITDYNVWNAHRFTSANALVPEPSASGLLWLAAISWLAWYRRK